MTKIIYEQEQPYSNNSIIIELTIIYLILLSTFSIMQISNTINVNQYN